MGAQIISSNNGRRETASITKLPTELRFAIYELALEDIVTNITSFISYPTTVHGVQFKPRGTLALLLTSKAVRAQSGEDLTPLMVTHCEKFKARVEMLELEWKMQRMTHGHPPPGETIRDVYWLVSEETKRDLLRCDRELANARVAMEALSTLKSGMQRAAKDHQSMFGEAHGIGNEGVAEDTS